MTSNKVTLIICDGMGLSPEFVGNAILQAATPTFDYLLSHYPSMRLLASGTEVGLDMGEPGNSEVGHLTIGTGQVIPQAYQVINGSIKSDVYKANKVFLKAMEKAKNNHTLHLVGLISAGGVHGHRDHMIALLKLAKERGVKRVAIHAITDGRDTPPQVALEDLPKIQEVLKTFEFGVVATIGGRYYALDRDANWERTDAYYWATLGKGSNAAYTPESAVQEGYGRGEGDETLLPTVILDQSTNAPIAPINPEDVVIFTNYRPDRIRQITTRIIMTQQPMTIVMMTNYFLTDVPRAFMQTEVLNAYPLPKPSGTLASVLSSKRLSQLHIAETEKYAHITYFFNGHEEMKKNLEEWLLVPSVKIDSFDRVPGMSAPAITQAYLNAKQNHAADFTTINYANMDMVGHTGNFEATKQAVTAVDAELRQIVDYCEKNQEWLIITADHGNAEQMINPQTNQPDKEHTVNPVPLIVVHPDYKKDRVMDKQQLAMMANTGILADIAPTILDIGDINKPSEMVGTSLIDQIEQTL